MSDEVVPKRRPGRYCARAWLIVAAVAGGVVVGAGCGGDELAGSASEAGRSGNAGEGSYMLVDRFTDPDVATMASKAEVVAVGTVMGPPDYFVNPREDSEELPEELREGQKLESVTLRVEEMIKGGQRESLTIVQDDLREVDHTDITVLTPGERVVVFLYSGEDSIATAPKGYFGVAGVDQGIFEIDGSTIRARTPTLFEPGAVLPTTLDELRSVVVGAPTETVD